MVIVVLKRREKSYKPNQLPLTVTEHPSLINRPYYLENTALGDESHLIRSNKAQNPFD
jgi:hypothetical protein